MNELLIDRLKTARITNGLKQQDVAEQMGIKANTISNWEKGRTEPDIDSFVRLCDIYKIDCASLLSDVYAFKRIGTDISLSEYDHIKKYRVLDEHGKDMIDTVLNKEYSRCTLDIVHESNGNLYIVESMLPIQKISDNITPDKSHLEPVAAHERTDIEVTNEMKQHDDGIMDDDEFWK